MKVTQETISTQEQTLIEKIRALPPERVFEVEDFIDFLQRRTTDGQLTRLAARLSEKVFQEVWDNPEDAGYDLL